MPPFPDETKMAKLYWRQNEPVQDEESSHPTTR